MSVQVRRDDGRVWIDGVEGWAPWEKESSVHAAEEAVMRAVGEDISYAYLLGVSGLAFRLQVSKDGLCPSSPHSFCGYQCVRGGVKALPWAVKIYQAKPDDAEKVKEARTAVVESIERGVPVQYGSEEDGIIVGHQKDGEEWVCHHPMKKQGKELFVEADWPWGIAVFTGPKENAPPALPLERVAISQIEKALAVIAGSQGGAA